MTRVQIQLTVTTHKYVFGDNVQERGLGGQAGVCRGEPNCYGVPTKKAPSMVATAFFSDDEFNDNIRVISNALLRIPQDARVLVILPGIGCGRAELPTRAPKTYAFLRRALEDLERNHQ